MTTTMIYRLPYCHFGVTWYNNISNISRNINEINDYKAIDFTKVKRKNVYMKTNNCEKPEKIIEHVTYEQLNQKFLYLKEKYANAFKELNDDVLERAYRLEYSKGGEGMQRGFYSPSSMDLVVGGLNRGRLYKRVPKKNTYDYEYIFDKDGRMICCKKYSDQFSQRFLAISIEFILYKENYALSLIYMPLSSNSLEYISECFYNDNKLLRYEHASCFALDHSSCSEIQVEELEYSSEGLESLLYSLYFPEYQNLFQDKFHFLRDERGEITTYMAENIAKHTSSNSGVKLDGPYRVRNQPK